MNKVKQIITAKNFLLLVFAVGIILISSIDKIFPLLDSQWLLRDKINAAILWLTASVVSWYTLEVARQTEVQLKPLPIIFYDKNADTFILKNIGNNSAININIQDVPLDDKQITIQFECVPILGLRESIAVSTISTVNGKNVDFPFDANLNPEYARENYSITIKYQNIEGKTYTSRIRTGKDGLKIYGVR